MRNFSVSAAVRVALVASTFVAVNAPITTLAAGSSPPNGEQSSRNFGTISVVGSRIRRTDIETSQPVQRLSNTELKATGLTTVGQILQRLTSSGDSINQLTNNAGNSNTINSPNGGAGEARVSLRYLGAQRTLVLVNGRRWVTGFGGAVDLNSIPLSVVDHIEVLQDGASAIYGSDAIAGVINIVTKKTFNGTEASAYYGEYFKGSHRDGTRQKYSFMIGSNADRYGAFFSTGYTQSDPIVNADRAIARRPVYPLIGTQGRGSSGTPQGRFQFFTPPIDNFEANGGNLPKSDNALLHLCASNGDVLQCDLTLKTGASGKTAKDFRPFSPTDNFNTAPQNYLLTPREIKQVFVHGHYNLNSSITFVSSVSYVDRKSVQLNAPMPLFFSANNIDFPIAANNPYNPFGFTLDPDINTKLIARRSIEMGPRRFDTNTTSFRFYGGFTGSWLFGSTLWNWDVGYVYGESRENDVFYGHFNLPRLSEALGDVNTCRNDSNGCVPYNLFGGIPSVDYHDFTFPPRSYPGSITPAMNNFVGATEQNTNINTLHNYAANLSSSDIAQLPAGPLGIAVGYEYRRIAGAFTPDVLLATGGSTSSPGVPVPAASGQTVVNAVYGELKVPILADVTMADSLGVDLASRYSRYEKFGETTTSRAGLTWRPIHDLLFRASWSQGFRAPSLNDLYSGRNHNFAFSGSDPCVQWGRPGVTQQVKDICSQQGVPPDFESGSGAETVVISGSNPDLKPETSISKTVGFVYSPKMVPGLNFNFDFYRIEVSNTIKSLDATLIADGCYYGGNERDCQLLKRSKFGSLTVIAVKQNIGHLLTEGFDAGFNYSLSLGDSGNLTFKLNATRVNVYEETQPDGAGGTVTKSYVGKEIGSGFPRGIPPYQAKFNILWHYRNLILGWTLRYVDAMTEKCSDYLDNTPLSLTNLGMCTYPNYDNNALSRNKLGGTTYNNVRASYAFNSINTIVSLGIRNVFDKMPPISRTAPSHFDPSLYEIPGRFVYLTVDKKF